MRVSATIGVVVCLLSNDGCQRNVIDKAISDRIDQRVEEALAPERVEIATLKGAVEKLDRRVSEIESRVQSGSGMMGPGMMGSGMVGPGMMQGRPPTSTTPTPPETPKQ